MDHKSSIYSVANPDLPVPPTVSIVESGDVRWECDLRDGVWQGLTQVSVHHFPLRSGRLPMAVEVRTPDGLELFDWRVVASESTGESHEVTLTPSVRSIGVMEWMVHAVRPRVRIDDWSQPVRPAPDTTLTLKVRQCRRRFGTVDALGLEYQYAYRSASLPIYRLLDRGSWEPGGSCVGTALWQRAGVPPIIRLDSLKQHYSSEWYLPTARNPSVFQFQPWQTHLQGFTFTTHPRGVLVTWARQVAHIRTLLEKRAGWAEILHLHEHCHDLGGDWATAPVEVLWIEGANDPVDQINLYESVRELVQDTLHDQIGLRRERVTTYGLIEEWGNADLLRYADRGVPKLLEAGVKTIALANHLSNNMNTFGVSNMCCTYDLRVAESVGEDRLQALCDKARAGGAVVEMWANTALSTLSLLLDKRNGREDRVRFADREGSVIQALAVARDPFVRTPSDAIDADHYTPEFAVMNLRDPDVRSFWLRQWKDLHDRIGLGGYFLDSSFNLTSDKFHWVNNPDLGKHHGGTIDQLDLRGHRREDDARSPQIHSLFRAHLDMVVAMQRLGYQYNAEDLGVFGIHRHGPRVQDRLNNLSIWAECLAEFDVRGIEEVGADPDDVFFRGLAYRLMWVLHWHVAKDEITFHYGGARDDRDRPSAWQINLLKVFNQVNDLMRNRQVWPGERAVEYHVGDRQVIWAFDKLTIPLDGSHRIHELTADHYEFGSEVRTLPRCVYLVEPAPAEWPVR